MRLGLVLGRLAILKMKLGADYDQLLKVVSSCFQGQKKNLIFLKKYCSVHTKKLHVLKVRKPKENLYDLSLAFLVSGASYRASYKTSFSLVLYDSPLSESKVQQN